MALTEKTFCEEVVVAGFGGQGIMLTGKLLAQTAMKAGRDVTYMPSYGAEVRGGTANCMVVIATEPIASPIVTRPDSLIAMNKASLNKFAGRVKRGGLLVINSSLIDEDLSGKLDETIEVLAVPADELAVELGNQKAANMVALGAYLERKGLFGADAAAGALPQVLARRYHKTLPVNTEALRKGAEFARNHTSVRQ
jgi:2-oxoglutarate ferredoxin oxidoreductase subunit gamma